MPERKPLPKGRGFHSLTNLVKVTARELLAREQRNQGDAAQATGQTPPAHRLPNTEAIPYADLVNNTRTIEKAPTATHTHRPPPQANRNHNQRHLFGKREDPAANTPKNIAPQLR